jgi:multidrug efflux pump subunit AcrA (membrane-fusion protein)
MFRQKALDALNTPEKLDQPIQLIRPTFWALLISLSGLTIYLIVWSVFGKIPVRISGKGILAETNTLQTLQSEQQGRLINYNVKAGDCIRKGQVVATIDPEDFQLRIRRIKGELSALQYQNTVENELAHKQLFIAQNDLNRLTPYRGQGSISEQTFIEKESLLQQLRAKLESEMNNRRNLILNKQLELDATLKEQASKTIIRSPQDGCVSDILAKIGQYLQPGSAVLELASSTNKTSLDSLGYFSPNDGKRIRVGQSVRITPSTTNAQRHGGIEGTVLSVKELPVSKEALMIRLGNTSVVDSIFNSGQNQSNPLIEVRTSLKKDPKTYSQYDWGGGPGPELKLSPGTPTEIRVLVEGRQPISYLIPLLRDLSGIY